jgi:hypothetical protein
MEELHVGAVATTVRMSVVFPLLRPPSSLLFIPISFHFFLLFRFRLSFLFFRTPFSFSVPVAEDDYGVLGKVPLPPSLPPDKVLHAGN